MCGVWPCSGPRPLQLVAEGTTAMSRIVGNRVYSLTPPWHRRGNSSFERLSDVPGCVFTRKKSPF